MLAQPPQDEDYAPAPGSMFDEHAAWGWDDVFPAMGGGRDPDHGFLWTTPMHAQANQERMDLAAEIEGWRYGKQLTLAGNRLHAVWHIANQAGQTKSALWVCHCLWDAKPGIRFAFPQGYDPILASEECEDAVYAYCPKTVMCAKQWGARAISKGECGFALPNEQVRVIIRYDAARLPFLGFWISTGGWRDTQQFAFEPSTSFYDTRARAEASGTLLTLSPGEAITLRMDIQFLSPKEDNTAEIYSQENTGNSDMQEMSSEFNHET